MRKILVGILFTIGLVPLSPSVSAGSPISVYRMYNPNSGEHLYTRSVGEKDDLRRYGWHYEDVAWQAPASGTSVYRLYNRYNGEHFYTIDAGEKDRVSHTGWTYESVAFYSYNGANRVPVTRSYNKYVSWHHYTLDQNERNITSRQGWRIEGTGWHTMSNSALNSVPVPSNEKVLSIPVIWQGNTMLCEGAPPLEGLYYKGVATNQSLINFVNYMPRANNNNPYHGYSGEWRCDVNDTYQGMMPDPIAKWAKNVGGNAVNITGPGANGTKNEIRNDSLVVTWITYNYATSEFKQVLWGRVVWSGHIILVDGFKNSACHVADPVFGAKWINAGTYEKSFNVIGTVAAVR